MGMIETVDRETFVEVRLDRPDKLNAVNEELLFALEDALEELHDESERPVLIAGNGRATCAGLDTEMATQNYPDDFPEFDRTVDVVSHLVETYPGPTVIAGKGAVVGLGFSLALRCDFVILGDETTFSMPEVRYGVLATHMAEYVASYAGPRVAKYLAVTGDAIDPKVARNVGLVSKVVPEDAVEEEARALIEQIVGYDTDTVHRFLDSI